MKPENVVIHIVGKYKTKEVFLNGNPLLPDKSLKLRNHSEGFDWGYCGNGASQFLKKQNHG